MIRYIHKGMTTSQEAVILFILSGAIYFWVSSFFFLTLPAPNKPATTAAAEPNHVRVVASATALAPTATPATATAFKISSTLFLVHMYISPSLYAFFFLYADIILSKDFYICNHICLNV